MLMGRLAGEFPKCGGGRAEIPPKLLSQVKPVGEACQFSNFFEGLGGE